jgi:hypothetical protein
MLLILRKYGLKKRVIGINRGTTGENAAKLLELRLWAYSNGEFIYALDTH